MASGTPAQRLVSIGNLFAANLSSTRYGPDIGVEKNSTTVDVTFTGDSILADMDDYDNNSSVGVRTYRIIGKSVWNTDTIHSTRRKTSHGAS